MIWVSMTEMIIKAAMEVLIIITITVTIMTYRLNSIERKKRLT